MAKTHEDIHSQALSSQFDELRALADGWFDGAGRAPDPVALDFLETWLSEHFPADVPVPAIVPTPEGDLLLEWNVPGQPSVDIRLSDFHAAFHMFLADGLDLESTCDLRSDAERVQFLDFLRRTVRGSGA